ncbi:MAG: hypothetical protein K9L22_02785 [Methylococcaceae bacterium]|nr:hypothetical protein [Methylococcaceae bacterium]
MNYSFFLYGRRFIIVSVFLLLAAIAFCYYVDPFSVYGRAYIKNGIQVNSPGFTGQLKMGKAIAIKQRKPEVIILGSSRSAFGFSAQSAEKYLATTNIYNLSYPGINIYENLRYLQHAVALSPIKKVFIGLDFYQFHGGRPPEKTFSEERLAVDVNNQPSASASKDLISTLLSGDAVFYSIKVATGLCNWDDVYLPNGFKSQDHEGGWSGKFVDSEEAYVDGTYTIPTFTFTTLDKKNTTFDFFRKIVQLAHEKQIDLRFFISPSHARQWEVIGQLGLWDQWEYWKREMLAITEQEARKYSQEAYPIYDFSGYSLYSTEAVPRSADQGMRWYSESSHYRQALGDIILDKMINSVDDAFGRILSHQNIDEHLKSLKNLREKYIAEHEQDIADIKALIDARKRY